LYRDILRQRVPPPPTSLGQRGAASGPSPRASDARETLTAPDAPIHEVPLIGRTRELTQLQDALAGAWVEAGSGPRLVAILGEAGLGKSRLIAELAAEAAGRGGRLLLGHGYETDEII